MAKKFKKVLLFAAAIGTVAAAAHHYLQKRNAADTPAEDEDYDDFSEDPDEEEVTKSRSYVPLTPEPKAEKPEEKGDSFTPLKDTVEQTVEKADDAIENVEEFFDEEDAEGEEPPVSEE